MLSNLVATRAETRPPLLPNQRVVPLAGTAGCSMTQSLWTESLRTHIPEIDAQHLQLFSVASQLRESISQGDGKSAINSVLLFLVEYTQVHFTTEERLLQAAEYSGLESHRQAHVAFVQQLRKAIERPLHVRPDELLEFIETWLIEHVSKTDREYVPYLLATRGTLPTPKSSAAQVQSDLESKTTSVNHSALRLETIK